MSGWRYASSNGEVDYLRVEALGPDVTVREALDVLGLDGPGVDTAIPQDWANHCRQATGIYPPGHVVVSHREEHNDGGCYGVFLPITLDGAIALYGPDTVRHDLEETLFFAVEPTHVIEAATAALQRMS